jgi:putative NADPH-quinone reductase
MTSMTSMTRQIALIDGRPDPDRARFCHALADAYAEAGETAGHTVRRIVEAGGLPARTKWLETVRTLGRAGQ